MDAPQQPTGLPPIAPAPVAVPGMSPASFAQFPPRAPASLPGNPVGRPSSDPEQQQQRVERSVTQRRLESITPTRAKDHKLHVFRTDRTGRSRGKHVLMLLATDIEAHLSSVPTDGRDEALDNLIMERLPTNLPDGRYKCQWYDAQNHPVMQPPPWEVQIGEEVDEDEVEDEEEFEEELPPQATMPVMPTFPQPLPAPPALDMATMGSAIRAERADADKRSNDTTAMIMGFMQLMTQQQMQAQQQQSQQQAAAEERDRARRAEFRTTLLTALPLVLPLITQLFAKPSQSGPSPELQMLLELVKGMATNKGSDAMIMEKMLTFQTEMTKNQLALQQQGATTAVQMQAEASSLVFKNLMGTMKEMMDNKPASGSGDGGVMDIIGKLAGPFLATMAANAQNPQAAPEVPQQAPPAQPQQRAPRAQVDKPAPPAAAEQSAPRRVVRRTRPEAPAQPAAPAVDPTKYPEPKRIAGAMRAVRGLSLGNPQPAERWNVVAWAAQMLPPSILEPVKAQDKGKVMEAALPVVMADSTLLQWITDGENAAFLEDFLQDVRLHVLGQVTPELQEASLIKGGQFVQRRRQAQTQATQAEQAAVAKHNNPPDAGEGAKPVQSASIVPQGGDNIITPPAPVVPAEPAPQPRTASIKQPPPQA